MRQILARRRWIRSALLAPALLATACQDHGCHGDCPRPDKIALAAAAFAVMAVPLGLYKLADDALALGPDPVTEGAANGPSLGTITADRLVRDIHFVDSDDLLIETPGDRSRENQLRLWHLDRSETASGPTPGWKGDWTVKAKRPIALLDTISTVGRDDELEIINNRDGSVAARLDLHSLADGPARPLSDAVLFAASPEGMVAFTMPGPVDHVVVADIRAATILPEPILPPSRSGSPQGPEERLKAVAFQPGQRILALAYADALKFWDLDSHRETREIPIEFPDLGRMAFSPDGRFVAIAGTTGLHGGDGPKRHLLVLRLADGAVAASMTMPGASPFADVKFSSDSRMLAFEAWNHVLIIDTTSFGVIGEIHNGRSLGLGPVALSPDSSRIAVGYGNQVHVFGLKTQSAAR